MIQNPFEQDKDRGYIWEMLVTRDIKAFLNTDWSMIEDDFITEGFIGIDGCHSNEPHDWKFKFPDLGSYKATWLQQASSFKQTKWTENPEEALFRITLLQDIEIIEDTALAHKIFTGEIKRSDGQLVPFSWRTLYYCRKINGTWRIVGFNGYLPLPSNLIASHLQKLIPKNAAQYKTSGPYSPVLILNTGTMVVISGQASILPDGNIKGNAIEEQAAYTLERCRQVLHTAGCSMADVFKVNAYLKDIADWPRFNEIYKGYFEEPYPVRTTVQAGLLAGLLIEIDLWAIKK